MVDPIVSVPVLELYRMDRLPFSLQMRQMLYEDTTYIYIYESQNRTIKRAIPLSNLIEEEEEDDDDDESYDI